MSKREMVKSRTESCKEDSRRGENEDGSSWGDHFKRRESHTEEIVSREMRLRWQRRTGNRRSRPQSCRESGERRKERTRRRNGAICTSRKVCPLSPLQRVSFIRKSLGLADWQRHWKAETGRQTVIFLYTRRAETERHLLEKRGAFN